MNESDVNESDKFNAIKDEYLFLMNAYESMDQRALLIKGWALTLIPSGIGFSYVYPIAQIPMLVLCLLASGVFWYLETTWKSFQYHFQARIQDIEAFARGEGDINLHPMQTFTRWFEAFHKTHRKRFMDNATMPIVFTPYLFLIIVIAVLLALANQP